LFFSLQAARIVTAGVLAGDDGEAAADETPTAQLDAMQVSRREPQRWR